MEELLEAYLPGKTDFQIKENHNTGETKLQKRQRLLTMAPQREIDLHGHTVKQAITRLRLFLGECKKDSLEKVLIIHGKGNHSASGPVLQKRILQFIQTSPLAGEYGPADRSSGGRGAMWVIIR
jgi:DNA-nicking Smr family endonuclease